MTLQGMPQEQPPVAGVVLPWSGEYARWYDLLEYDHPYGSIANDIAILARKRWGTQKRSVVEVGCGTGTLTYFLRHRLPADWELIGCDPSEGMIKMARSKYSSMHWENTTFPGEEKVDLVVASFNVVNYVQDLDSWLKVAVAHLEDDGMLLFDALDAEEILRNGMQRISRRGTHGRYTFWCDMVPDRHGEEADLDYHVTITKDRKPHAEFTSTHLIVLWTMRRIFDCLPAGTYVRVQDWGAARVYIVTRRP